MSEICFNRNASFNTIYLSFLISSILLNIELLEQEQTFINVKIKKFAQFGTKLSISYFIFAVVGSNIRTNADVHDNFLLRSWFFWYLLQFNLSYSKIAKSIS